MSPETLMHNQYSPKTDIWSLGTVLYEMIYGRKNNHYYFQGIQPFFSHSEQELAQKLSKYGPNGIIKFAEQPVSQKTKEIIQGMLYYEPKKRWSLDQVMNCLNENKLNTQRQMLRVIDNQIDQKYSDQQQRQRFEQNYIKVLNYDIPDQNAHKIQSLKEKHQLVPPIKHSEPFFQQPQSNYQQQQQIQIQQPAMNLIPQRVIVKQDSERQTNQFYSQKNLITQSSQNQPVQQQIIDKQLSNQRNISQQTIDLDLYKQQLLQYQQELQLQEQRYKLQFEEQQQPHHERKKPSKQVEEIQLKYQDVLASKNDRSSSSAIYFGEPQNQIAPFNRSEQKTFENNGHSPQRSYQQPYQTSHHYESLICLSKFLQKLCDFIRNGKIVKKNTQEEIKVLFIKLEMLLMKSSIMQVIKLIQQNRALQEYFQLTQATNMLDLQSEMTDEFQSKMNKVNSTFLVREDQYFFAMLQFNSQSLLEILQLIFQHVRPSIFYLNKILLEDLVEQDKFDTFDEVFNNISFLQPYAYGIILLDHLVTLYQVIKLFLRCSGFTEKFVLQSSIQTLSEISVNQNITKDHWIQIGNKIETLKLNKMNP